MWKSIAFLYTRSEQVEFGIRKNTICIKDSKNEIDINLTKCVK